MIMKLGSPPLETSIPTKHLAPPIVRNCIVQICNFQLILRQCFRSQSTLFLSTLNNIAFPVAEAFRRRTMRSLSLADIQGRPVLCRLIDRSGMMVFSS